MAALLAALLLAPVAWAQSADNLPPVAAPTSHVQVDAIPIVRSDAEKTADFTAGLLRGVRVDPRITGLAVTAVQEDHTIFQLGNPGLNHPTLFTAGGMERVVYAVALLQFVEAGKLRPDADIGRILQGSSSGVTLAAAMTRRPRDDGTLAAVIEKLSAKPLDQYLAGKLFLPLGMTATTLVNGSLRTSLADMSRFAAALSNGGTAGGATILQNSSVQMLESDGFAPYWGFGLPEMRRNGWIALQLDGSADADSMRFVLVPDAKLAYLIVLRGGADARTWRVLDDALFDQLLPARVAPASPPSSATSGASARAVVGTYDPDPALRSFVFLKFPNRELRVTTAANNSLVLSGAENAVMIASSGGTWSAADGSLAAVYRNNELFLSSGAAYRPVAFYQRPVVYALLALVAALAVIGAVLFEKVPLRRLRLNSRTRDVSVS